MVLALATGVAAQIPLELRFDGRALTPTAPPDFSCFNCMVGDTTQSLAQNLSQALLDAGRHDEAIEVCWRLVERRGAEVSPYKLAETWDRIAWAHWLKGDRQRALEIVREALAKYGGTVRGDVLRQTLARFEGEQPAAK